MKKKSKMQYVGSAKYTNSSNKNTLKANLQNIPKNKKTEKYFIVEGMELCDVTF